jgi:photosystem II stability/assembly factor-like uncharacterized protein
MRMGVPLLVGTRKGLFLVPGDGNVVEEPVLPGWSVYHAVRDRRDGSIQVAANHAVYGGTFQRSDDGGKTWRRTEGLGLPEGSELKLAETWHVEPGREAGEIWLGATPGVLFRSTDGGETFEPVQSVLEHPTRERWNPGAGGMCCHSIQLDPSDPQRMYIAISAAGTFRTDDGGETWEPKNQGVAADFFPEPDNFPEVGQCVHKLLLHPGRPGRMWQQNHCGVYRSDDHGDTWERLEGNGLPSGFGFPLALDARDPDAAYVIPEVGAENRVTPDGRLGVYRTADAGLSWELASDGLPEPAWGAVMREGFAFDESGGVYFGTQSGSVFASPDGWTWDEVARQLPPILSVEVGEWS